MTNYPVGDFLIRVKNAALARKRDVVVMNTKLINEVAKVLKKEGFLDEIRESKGELLASLVFRKKEPILLGIKLVSKPGLRIYMGVDELKMRRGPSVFIISTPKGVMSSDEAKKKRLGGEVIAEVW